MCNKNFNTCSAVSVQVSVQPWVTHCCLHGIMSTINIGVFSPEWGGGGSGVGGGEGWVGGERVGRGGDCWVLWRGLGGGGGESANGGREGLVEGRGLDGGPEGW